MNKHYLSCIILIVLFMIDFIFNWLVHHQINTFDIGMMIIVLLIMGAIYILSRLMK